MADKVDPKTVWRLAQNLKDADKSVRGDSVFALGMMADNVDSKTMDALAKCLEDPHRFVRSTSARTLGKMADKVDPKTTESLAYCLEDPDAEVSSAAVHALHNMADKVDPEAMGALTQCLKDPTEAVRMASQELPVGLLGRALHFGETRFSNFSHVRDTEHSFQPLMRSTEGIPLIPMALDVLMALDVNEMQIDAIDANEMSSEAFSRNTTQSEWGSQWDLEQEEALGKRVADLETAVVNLGGLANTQGEIWMRVADLETEIANLGSKANSVPQQQQQQYGHHAWQTYDVGSLGSMGMGQNVASRGHT
jgi:hypothetical protein